MARPVVSVSVKVRITQLAMHTFVVARPWRRRLLVVWQVRMRTNSLAASATFAMPSTAQCSSGVAFAPDDAPDVELDHHHRKQRINHEKCAP